VGGIVAEQADLVERIEERLRQDHGLTETLDPLQQVLAGRTLILADQLKRATG
jgi:hypothetical protein